MHAATLTQDWMTELFEALPHYYNYHRRTRANHDEATFRLALGQRLQDLGQRLLDTAENRPHLLSPEQLEIIEMVTDDITTILKLLNRSGAIHLEGEPGEVVPELEAVDGELLLLLETMWQEGEGLFADECSRFDAVARELAGSIEAFLDRAEERNRLLGLGWESEFGWSIASRLDREVGN